jgi:predicted outer membrane protein
MRSGTVVALVIVGLLGVVLVTTLWRARTADNEPRLSPQGRMLVQKALTILENQRNIDQLAAMKARVPSVREFAQSAGSEHENLRNQLVSIVRTVEPDFPPQTTAPETRLHNLSGVAFDREYLQAFRQRHIELQAAVGQVGRDEPQALQRFIASWTGAINRHLATADRLLMELPKVASNLSMLLVVGACSIACALGIAIRERLRAS